MNKIKLDDSSWEKICILRNLQLMYKHRINEKQATKRHYITSKNMAFNDKI